VFELRGQIHDDDGNVLYDGPIHRINVTAGPCDGVMIEMTWDTPADDDQTDESGTDVDLHFVIAPHEFESPLDCYFMNPNPDWGEVGLFDDDCRMDIDDTNGAGPERITLPQVLPTAPLGGPYVIGTHYYRSTAANEVGDLGPSTVTVRIWVRGELTFEESAVLESQGDWWIAAEIHRDDDGIQVVARNTVHDGVPPARP